MSNPKEQLFLSHRLQLAPLWWPLGQGMGANIRMGDFLVEWWSGLPCEDMRIYAWDKGGNHQYIWTVLFPKGKNKRSCYICRQTGRLYVFSWEGEHELSRLMGKWAPELRSCVRLFLHKLK